MNETKFSFLVGISLSICSFVLYEQNVHGLLNTDNQILPLVRNHSDLMLQPAWVR